MLYTCSDQLRRNALKGTALNGIDYVEVDDHDAPDPDRQRLLQVYFVNPITPLTLSVQNFQIEGGDRIRHINITDRAVGSASNIIVIRVDRPGDFSTYTLRLVKDPENTDTPDGYDPVLSSINFSFKVECKSDFDCQPKHICPPKTLGEPEINYLAKDYSSLRRLILDRIASLIPGWKERNPADLEIALVELLAYVGDQLSYQQDAVATDAYFGKTRSRISARRHALLVDYSMHNGCNARTWIQIDVKDHVDFKRGTQLLTRIATQGLVVDPSSAAYRQALVSNVEVFESMEEKTLFPDHNELHFYTGGDNLCCLPKGATEATLDGHYPLLYDADHKIYAILILEEVLGPKTGVPEDADPSHRHAIRLTGVNCTTNGNPLTDPLNNHKITEITWEKEDRLPFPLCISTVTDKEHNEKQVTNVSVAKGNVILADHGRTIDSEPIIPDTVPQTPPTTRPSEIGFCKKENLIRTRPRYHPSLKSAPLTHADPYLTSSPATKAMIRRLNEAVPQIVLTGISEEDLSQTTWTARADLVDSPPDDRGFVAEMETDGTAYLRFGDDMLGASPNSGTTFTATYRVGNGKSGNIGAEAISHIVLDPSYQGVISAVRNPLPAQGGTEPETIEEVRQRAPYAFRIQERAVTPEDYEATAELDQEVLRTAATFRWTGSWYTVFLTIDRKAGLPVEEDTDFENRILSLVEKYRMAGHDLEVNGPVLVSLEIEMEICVKPDHFRADVKEALLEILSNRLLPDGRKGIFYPDNLTFGQTLFLSRVYAAAQSVEGVASVRIKTFRRQGDLDTTPPLDQKLTLGRLEVARLDNDPNYPEHGILSLTMEGGK